MNLSQKLLEIQKEIKPIEKDSVNPHFKNSYFDINTLLAKVKPILNKHGVVLSQPLGNLEGRITLQTSLHDTESKETVTHITFLPECADAQKYGSAISYFRRYSLVSLLALEGEDDDGNTAKPKEKIIQTEDKDDFN